MKNILVITLVTTIFSFTLFSCSEDVTTIPGSTGAISELAVVADDDAWDKLLNDTVHGFFNQQYPWVNQVEPAFNSINISKKELKETFINFRNLLIFEIDKEKKEGQVLIQYDRWAKPQTVIQVFGQDKKSLLDAFLKNKELIIKAFNDSETRRIKGIWERGEDKTASKKIKDLLDVTISVPEGYWIAGQDLKTVWVRKWLRQSDQETGFTITVVPYTDTMQFSTKYILSMRDSVLKTNVPIQNTESYMGTEYQFYPQSKVIELNNIYTVETRGFWTSINSYFGGGPFINFMIHDGKNERLIMFDGYVFKPNENKRDLVRQVEAIAYTIKLEKQN